MKCCNQCGIDKDESEFSKRKASQDGLQYACKPCSVNSVLKRRQTKSGKEIHRKAQYKYYRTKGGKVVHDNAQIKYMSTEKGQENRRIRHRRYQYKKYKADPEYYHLKSKAYYHGCDVGVLKQVRERDKVCQLCGTDKDMQFDHIYPVSLGGKGTLENLQLLCGPCNNFKSNNLFLPGGGMLVTQACNI